MVGIEIHVLVQAAHQRQNDQKRGESTDSCRRMHLLKIRLEPGWLSRSAKGQGSIIGRLSG